MDCVNCEHENPEKALICYWCGLDPETGEMPYKGLGDPLASVPDALSVAAIAVPPPIEVPPLAAISGAHMGESIAAPIDLEIGRYALGQLRHARIVQAPDAEQPAAILNDDNRATDNIAQSLISAAEKL